MSRDHIIKLEKVTVATMIAQGLNQKQISERHGFKSTGSISEFMKEHLPTLLATYDKTPAAERAKAWLEAHAKGVQIEHVEPPKRKGPNPGISKSHYFESYDKRRAPQPRSLCCPYYIGKERRVCGAHRGASPYCDTHMEATAPLVVRV